MTRWIRWLLRELDYCQSCWENETKLVKLHFAFLRADTKGGSKKFMHCTKRNCRYYVWK